MASCLRISGLTIGYIQLFLNVMGTIAVIVLLCLTNQELAQLQNKNGQRLELSPEDTHVVQTVATWMYVILVIASIVGIAIVGLLLYGIHKNREGFMLPWLILSGIGLVFSALNFLWTIVSLIRFGDAGLILAAALCLLILGIQFTIWRVIHLLYREIKTNNQVNTENFKQFSNQYARGQI